MDQRIVVIASALTVFVHCSGQTTVGSEERPDASGGSSGSSSSGGSSSGGSLEQRGELEWRTGLRSRRRLSPAGRRRPPRNDATRAPRPGHGVRPRRVVHHILQRRRPRRAEYTPARPTPTAPRTVGRTARTRTACTGNALSTSASPTRTAPRRRSVAARRRTTDPSHVISRTSASRPTATWTPTAVLAASVRRRPAIAGSSRASTATKRLTHASIPASTVPVRAQATAPASTPRPPVRGSAGQTFARGDVGIWR